MITSICVVVTNPCDMNNGGCSHLCLLSSTSARGFTCVCPDNMLLGIDGLSCTEGKLQSLFLTVYDSVILLCFWTFSTVSFIAMTNGTSVYTKEGECNDKQLYTWVLVSSTNSGLTSSMLNFFISGSCNMAGYTNCCNTGMCWGSPASCFCDLDCYHYGDCCTDIDSSCSFNQTQGRYFFRDKRQKQNKSSNKLQSIQVYYRLIIIIQVLEEMLFFY